MGHLLALIGEARQYCIEERGSTSMDGTGKTSAAVSVAVSLAEKDKKASLSMQIRKVMQPRGGTGETAIKHDLADVLLKKYTAKEAIIAIPKTDGLPPFPKNLSLIPTASLGSDLRLYSKTAANQAPFAVRQLLKTIRDDFDFTIIDTSPSIGGLEESDCVNRLLNFSEKSH